MPDPLPMPSPGPEIPPDHAERGRALDPTRSFLVQAPAGSGKTYLLTQRFLRLLAEAEKPDEIVAITFTNAAAAEMRNRVLEALEHAELGDATENDPESLMALAARAMQHAKLRGWQILDQPGLLRITTIDAFCRGLALQCPLNWGLLSSLGGRLETVEKAEALYKQAASRTLAQLGGQDSPTRQAIEQLLLWRDNNWLEVEELIVDMLGKRNRWYQEFVFARDGDWDALRARLEGAFCRGARSRLETLRRLMDSLPGCGEFALELARGACESPGTQSPFSLAERAELPAIFPEANDAGSKLLLEDAVTAYRDLANFLMSLAGSWRKKGGLTERQGFPATTAGRQAKDRFAQYVEGLAQERGLEAALAAFQKAVPVRYSEEEWELVKSCFAVLRAAAGELLELFAEAGAVDFTEVSQIALQVLIADDGSPSDFALRQADGIRHLLMDEFQDTSRNQHQLLSRLIGAWPDHAGRSCFCVGDPMQSIYSFRDAEVELFERLKTHGLDIASEPEPYRFEFVALRANFRTVPTLVNDLNGHFGQIFAEDDGSGVRFAPAEAARKSASNAITELHLAFSQSTRTSAANRVPFGDPEETKKMQLQEMVALIQSKLAYLPAKRLASEKYRIAVLGRTRKSLIPVAEALSAAGIGYRAVDLVQLKERSEVLDALALARALLNPVDRTAWLGLLRAPWCGLSLAELHLICGADDEQIQATPIPLLLETRLPQLHATGQLDERAYRAASRVSRVLRSAVDHRSTAAASTLGTWLESVWIALGGQETVNLEQRENLRLLWSAFDGLPEGELDIFGAALTAALDDLFALPDPEASSTLGVQLMTIHKSKGLEFEIVLVAELQAESAKSERGMVSWLERGLSESEGERELTEFLIAPIQTKGGEAGEAKAWVDGVKRAREQQELRRLLYVAATRAREELHLFVRPGFTAKQPDKKALASGPILEQAKPTGLLATAWPAVGDAIEARFNAWKHELKEEDNQKDAVLGAIAAQAGTVVAIPNQEDEPSQEGRPTRMRRLPLDYVGPEYPRRSLSVPSSLSDAGDESEDDPAQSDLYARTEGGLRSRLEGKAIHTLLEQLSLLRLTLAPEAAVRELATSLPRIAASMRSEGLTLPTARRMAESAIAVASRAALHPVGGWILAPHAEAQSEARWTGLVDSELTQDGRLQQRNLRPDRVFLAAPATLPVAVESDSPDAPVWWIIDYKSSHAGEANLAVDAEKVAFLATHRELYRGQLAVYAHILRALHAPDTTRIRTGIYYTRLGLFDSWPA